jgi:solute carrier family 25 carnitine/acylcarnitine transporter 20/29
MPPSPAIKLSTPENTTAIATGLAAGTALATTTSQSEPKPQTSNSSGFLKFVKDCVSGTVGGIAVVAVGHPFDTIKVRLQSQSIANPVYSGAFDCVKKTLAWEGVGGLYKGVASPLAGQMLFRATLFSAFGESKRWLGTNADGTTRELTNLDFYKAGMMTGFVAAFTEAPIDFYKSQIQVQILRSKADPTYKPPYTTVTECVKSTLKTSGVRGPFQGLGPTILRNTPANAVYLGSFEVMKKRLAEMKECQVSELSAPLVIGAGGFGGILYWLCIYPVDVIKSAMMTDSIIPSERKYPNTLATAKKLWGEGGVARFYKGFTPCIMRAAPANGVMLYTVGKMQSLLN